ncbi:hypothetical protein SFC52_04050 [Niallia circulans]|uniref:hypothetical protein n=1 Tax=Niallia circulans TaxID=1397 RepID=UPI003981B451
MAKGMLFCFHSIDFKILSANVTDFPARFLFYHPNLWAFQPNFWFISQIFFLSAKTPDFSAKLLFYQPKPHSFQPNSPFISQNPTLFSQTSSP